MRLRPFESVARHEDHEIQGTYLHAHALIKYGDTSRAVALLEPLQDLSLGEAVKQDFLYLSGKAFEKMGDLKKSKEYYRKVFTMNPRYRDVASRMK